MGYDLSPRHKDVEGFHFGAFSWVFLLEECANYLWPMAQGGARWYCLFGRDPRMPEGETYPRLISNDGFRVTAEEARWLGRAAGNWAAIQRTLPESHRLEAGSLPKHEWEKPFPQKVRDDWVELFERFAEWAPKSGGFAIW